MSCIVALAYQHFRGPAVFTLKMEAVRSSEMLESYCSTTVSQARRPWL